MTRTMISRPEDLIHELNTNPSECEDLVYTFARMHWDLELVTLRDGSNALAHRDGHNFRIRHAAGTKFFVDWTDQRKRVLTLGAETRMPASQAVEQLVRFARGE